MLQADKLQTHLFFYCFSTAVDSSKGGRDIFHELDYQEQHDRRFVTEEEERNVVANDDKPDLGSLTTPTFVWKTEDIDTARTLISLRVGKKKIGVPY
jgi:hypothetical protein